MNTNLETTIQTLIDEVDGTTPPHQLQKLKVLAAGLMLDESELEAAVDALADAVTTATPLAEIFALAQASKSPRSVVSVGDPINLPIQYPAIYSRGTEEYVRAGTFKTSGYDPSLEFMRPVTVGFAIPTGFVASVVGVTDVARKADTDGQGLWITYLQGSGLGVHRTIDDFVTLTNINTAVGVGVNEPCFIKHVSGVGSTSIWLLQTPSGFKRSIDGGQNWSNAATNGTPSSNPFIAVNGNVVIIGGSGGNGYYRRSTDGGVNFGTDVTLGGNTPRAHNGIHTVGGKFVICGSAYFVDNVRPAIWVSEDNGATFGTAQNLLPAFVNQPAIQLIFSSLTNRLYVTVNAAALTYYTTTFTASAFGTMLSAIGHQAASYTTLRLGEDGVFIYKNAPGASSLSMVQEVVGQASLSSIGQVRAHSGDGDIEYGKNGKWLLMTDAGNPYIGLHGVGMYPAFTSYVSSNEAQYMRVN